MILFIRDIVDILVISNDDLLNTVCTLLYFFKDNLIYDEIEEITKTFKKKYTLNKIDNYFINNIVKKCQKEKLFGFLQILQIKAA